MNSLQVVTVPPAGVEPTAGPDDLARAAAVAGDARRALDLALELGCLLPRPGFGRTAVRWRWLRDIAAADLTTARVLEAHADALAILGEAADAGFGRSTDDDGLWGVFAAERPGLRVDAAPTVDGWSLRGTKPWCSLAGSLDRALLTAHAGTERRLFAIDLTDGRVAADPVSGWVARGLVEVPSTSVRLDGCPADPVGPVGWYLERPGFAWGGMGVAACWLGGAIGIARTLRSATLGREPDQIGLAHLGAIDSALFAANAVLAAAADAVDAGRADGRAGALWASRVRAVVAGSVETVLTRAAHALGPAPLAFDAAHARRFDDLQLYVRQHHAERDDAALGAQVLDLASWH